MTHKEYKPERPVTSSKIKDQLVQLCRENYDITLKRVDDLADTDLHIDIVSRGMTKGNWSRMWRAKLPDSKNNIRGFKCYKLHAIAISDPDDAELLQVYFVHDADEERKKLGVLEVILG